MIKLKTIQLDKNKIIEQLCDAMTLIESGKWKLEYDADLDELFLGMKVIPKKSFLYNLNGEINIFITPESKINGFFIEYFAKNYLKHNKKLSPVLDALKTAKKGQDKEKNTLAKDALENKLVNEALSSVINKKKMEAVVN